MQKRARFISGVCLGIAIAAFAAPAAAVPITVMFDGIQGFGMSEASAFDARDNFGIQIIDPGFADSAFGILDIAFQDLDETSINPFPPSGPGPHTATSHWAMQNVSGADLMDLNLMIFVTVDPFQSGPNVIDYPDAMVGLSIDADDGWMIVNLSDGQGQEFYYPALLLGALETDEISDVFFVNYYVDGEIQQVGVTYILPKLRYGFGIVPEPGTFSLMALGLAGLAARRRRRA